MVYAGKSRLGGATVSGGQSMSNKLSVLRLLRSGRRKEHGLCLLQWNLRQRSVCVHVVTRNRDGSNAIHVGDSPKDEVSAMNLPLQMSAIVGGPLLLVRLPKVDSFGRVMPAKSHTVTGCSATQCDCSGNTTDFACCAAGEFCTCTYTANSPPLPGCATS